MVGTRPESVRLFGKLNSKVDFDATTNRLVGIEHLEDGDIELKMERSFEQLHFGQYGGWFTKVLYALGGFCLSVISLTGFVIWFKKR
ncbi:MAG: PepSY-associated TM helix domain-containing protein [Spirosomataceae bacterium]